MKTIIQSITLAVCVIVAISVVVFGAAYGIKEYEYYKEAFVIMGAVSGISILVLVFVVADKIVDGEI